MKPFHDHPLPCNPGGRQSFFAGALRGFRRLCPAGLRAASASVLWVTTFLFGGAGAIAFVHETAEEFLIRGDFTGTGGEDFLVLDRASGLIRLGTEGGNGLVWERVLATGLGAVRGAALQPGPAGVPARLAMTAPEANHFRLVGAGDAPQVAVFPGGIGPVAVAPAAGADGGVDWIVSSVWNNANPHPQRLERLTNDGSGFSPGPPQVVSHSWRLPNLVRLMRGGSRWLAVVEEDAAAGEARFAVHPEDVPDWDPVLQTTGLPEGECYVYGFFDDTGMAAFLFHGSGRSSVEVWRVVKSGEWVALEEWGTIDFGAPVRQMAVLQGTAHDRLVVLFADSGGGGMVYDWDGATAPDPVLTIHADAGLALTGVLPLSDGGFLVLEGLGGISARYVRFSPHGAGYSAVDAGALGPLRPGLHTANVHFFAREPFVHPTPRWLGSAKARDWTSAVRQAGDSWTWEVLAEVFADEARGLGGGFWMAPEPVPEETGFALINQYAPGISVFSFTPSLDGVPPPPVILPFGGRHAGTVRVSIEANAGLQVYHRMDPSENWAAYSGPRPIYRDHTVQAFAIDEAGRRSTVRSARYTFTLPPEHLDSNGDGVPDFVKLAFGLDPHGPADSTGNGFTDLEELLAGCDPSDPSDTPADRVAGSASLALRVLPLAYDGFAEQSAPVTPGTTVRAFDATGTGRLALAAAEPAVDPGGWPRAHLECFPLEPDEALILVATDFHFRILTELGDELLGRELLAFTEVPPGTPGRIDFQYEGDGLMEEALRWREALQMAHALALPPPIEVITDPVETLLVASLERRIGLLLEARGWVASSLISLTPFRGDAPPRTPVGADLLSHLQGRDGPHPPLNLRTLFSELREAVLGDDPGGTALRDLGIELYRISSTLADNAPGQFMLPFDALREFVAEGQLPPTYAEQSRLTEAELDFARIRVAQLMDLPAERPEEVFLATIPTAFPPGAPTLLTSLAMEKWALFNEQGEDFSFPSALALLPGSRIRVEGYVDLATPAEADRAIEVNRIELLAVPLATPADADGNLLGDDWERLHFGTTGHDPFAVADGSAYSLLQQYLEGTNPLDPLCLPEGPALNLEPPVVRAVRSGNQLALFWKWPERHAADLEFLLFTSTDLIGFEPTAHIGTHHGGGSFSLAVPLTAANDGRILVRLGMRLR